jgi:hypothetical protein
MHPTTRHRGRVLAGVLNVDSVEPWALPALLELVHRKADKAGIDVGVVVATVCIGIEWREGEGSLETFTEALRDQHVSFTFKEKAFDE